MGLSTKKQNVIIIDYGAGNIQSIQFALQRLGFEGILSNDSDQILKADKVIFPGVGQAQNAMSQLIKTGLHEIIPTLTMPVLGICLGMQLLCKSSEEGKTTGLGVFDVDVLKFNNSVKVPQMGWNSIYNLKNQLFNAVSNNEYMYLIHSFYAPLCAQTVATTYYQTEYSSALQHNNFFGTQFHPEKSGKAGEQILHNFLKL